MDKKDRKLLLSSIIDLENMISTTINNSKCMHNGGFDHILKFNYYKSEKIRDKILKRFDTKIKSLIITKDTIGKKNRFIIYPDTTLFLILNIIFGL